MIGYILIAVAALVLVVLLVKPKLGAVLVWPILLVYPHLYMEQLEILPWNAGVDDLFIAVLFLIVVFQRNLLGGSPVRFGYSMIAAVTMLVVITIANLSGWALEPTLPAVVTIKPMLKAIIFALFTYVMVNTIDDEHDIRRAALVHVTFLAVAAFTVVLHKMFPAQMVIFTLDIVEQQLKWYGKAPRAVGSLTNFNTGCAMLGMTVLVALNLLRLPSSTRRKVFLIGCIVMLLVGMVLTESRSGALALGVALLAMGVLSRYRLYALALVCTVGGAVAFKPDLFLDYWDRIAQIYNPAAGGQWGENAAGRFDIWRAYVSEPQSQVYLFGQGRTVAIIRNGSNAHSGYLTAVYVLGFGGVVWALAFFGSLAFRAWHLMRLRVEPYATIGAGVLWALLALAAASLTVDMLLQTTVRYVYLFYAVLIERSLAVARQTQPANTLLRPSYPLQLALGATAGA